MGELLERRGKLCLPQRRADLRRLAVDQEVCRETRRPYPSPASFSAVSRAWLRVTV